jgi:hypothetical protein
LSIAVIECILTCCSSDSEDSTQVCVLCAPLIILEELSELPRDTDLLESPLEVPFRVIHESWTSCDIGQLALEYMDDELVLLVVHRPRALVFHYLESGQRGNLLLGPIQPYSTLVRESFSLKVFKPTDNRFFYSDTRSGL